MNSKGVSTELVCILTTMVAQKAALIHSDAVQNPYPSIPWFAINAIDTVMKSAIAAPVVMSIFLSLLRSEYPVGDLVADSVADKGAARTKSNRTRGACDCTSYKS